MSDEEPVRIFEAESDKDATKSYHLCHLKIGQISPRELHESIIFKGEPKRQGSLQN